MRSLISILRQKLFKAHTSSPKPVSQKPPVSSTTLVKSTEPASSYGTVVFPFGEVRHVAVDFGPSGVKTVMGFMAQNKTRDIVAHAPNIEVLHDTYYTLRTATLVLQYGLEQSREQQEAMFFELLGQVRGNRADHVPTDLHEARHLLRLAVESVHVA